jgi:hypothetical protein
MDSPKKDSELTITLKGAHLKLSGICSEICLTMLRRKISPATLTAWRIALMQVADELDKVSTK